MENLRIQITELSHAMKEGFSEVKALLVSNAAGQLEVGKAIVGLTEALKDEGHESRKQLGEVLNVALGRKQLDKDATMLIFKVWGYITMALIGVIVFLMTGDKHGIIELPTKIKTVVESASAPSIVIPAPPVSVANTAVPK